MTHWFALIRLVRVTGQARRVKLLVTVRNVPIFNFFICLSVCLCVCVNKARCTLYVILSVISLSPPHKKFGTDYYLGKLPTFRPFQYLFNLFSHMQLCWIHYTEVTSVTAALIIHAKLTHPSVGAICHKSHEQSPRCSIPTYHSLVPWTELPIAGPKDQAFSDCAQACRHLRMCLHINSRYMSVQNLIYFYKMSFSYQRATSRACSPMLNCTYLSGCVSVNNARCSLHVVLSAI
uniref:Uncharacterized protein n=1 Tax=Hyaloperonospora arabidopsidis (strain Emoy2) TaxID=559515 RepID=M4BLT8_HYAAE